MNNRRLLGILGSTLLFVGVFMPIVKLPIVGDMNYFANGKWDGIFPGTSPGHGEHRDKILVLDGLRLRKGFCRSADGRDIS
jgi:hypothetical protein